MVRNNIKNQLEKIRKDRELLDKREKQLLEKANEKVLAQIVQLAKGAGLSAATVTQAMSANKSEKTKIKKTKTSSKSALAGVKIPPRYRNPANPEQTWTGRGVAPSWAQALKQTGQLENARIVETANPVATSAEITYKTNPETNTFPSSF